MPAPYTTSRIVMVAFGSAILAAIAGMVFSVVAMMLVLAGGENAESSEGAVLGLILVTMLIVAVVGPLTFFVVCMVGSRRSNHVMRPALPFIGFVCFAPTLLVLLVMLNELPGKRGLKWVIPVVMGVVVIAMVGWLVESLGKLSTKTAIAVSMVAVLAVTAGFAGSAAVTDGFRRDRWQAALSSEFSTMYLLSEPGTGPQIWETSTMWAADPVNSPLAARSHVMHFANANGAEVQLRLKTASEQKYCDWLSTQGRSCDVVLTTAAGRTIEYESRGRSSFDVTIRGEHVPLRTTNHNVTIAEIEALVDALTPVTVEAWIAELQRRDD